MNINKINPISSAYNKSAFQDKSNKKQTFSDTVLSKRAAQVSDMQKQLDDMNKDRIKSSIYNKMLAGGELTDDELKHLQSTDIELYNQAVKIKNERIAYRKALENCRTKEDVEKLHNMQMQGFINKARAISTNSNISKERKQQLLDYNEMHRNALINVYTKFLDTQKFRKLPDIALGARETAEEK
jgi:uncharacterized coiled-coil DUF342 family protein